MRHVTSQVLLLYSLSNGTVFSTTSSDDGSSWSTPADARLPPGCVSTARYIRLHVFTSVTGVTGVTLNLRPVKVLEGRGVFG